MGRASTLLVDVEADFGVINSVGLALFDLEGDGDLDILVGGGRTARTSCT